MLFYVAAVNVWLRSDFSVRLLHMMDGGVATDSGMNATSTRKGEGEELKELCTSAVHITARGRVRRFSSWLSEATRLNAKLPWPTPLFSGQ